MEDSFETYYKSLQVTTPEPTMSDQINELATSLCAVQKSLKHASKDAQGYGYTYANLTTCIEAARDVLAENGLSVSQLLTNSGSNGASITTILLHSSGQFLRSTYTIPKVDMKGCNVAQELGASISYGRRYAFQAIIGMSSEDNDASSKGLDKPAKKTSFTKKAASETKEAPTKFRKPKSAPSEVEHDI